MGNEITKLDLQKEWKSISEEAYKRADKTHDQFGRELVLIGAGFTALTALMVNVKPDLVGITIATAFPFAAAITSHIKNYREEHFYKAFASHALDMRDLQIIEGKEIKLPRIDHEIMNFRQSGLYQPPSRLNVISQFRSAIIGVAAGTAMTIAVGYSREGYDAFGFFRKEEDTSQTSIVEQSEQIPPVLSSPAP